MPSIYPSQFPTFGPSIFPTASPSGFPNCPVGTYYIQFPSYYECFPCAQGYYSNAANVSTCIECPLNTYVATIGSTICTSCPSGSVNSNIGSTSKSDCVNPSINFAFGILSLVLAFVAVTVYIIFGRLQRVAFERRRYLIEKSISLYGILFSMIDDAKRMCMTIKFIQIRKKRQRDEEFLQRQRNAIQKAGTYAKKLFIPLLFLLVATILLLTIFASTLIAVTLQVLFNAMLLFRGYRFYVNIGGAFYDRISAFLSSIGGILALNAVSDAVIYPVNYILSLLAFDLSTVKVSCSGSQAPINLLLDCFIAAAIVISINSDANLFWITRVRTSTQKLGSLLLNRFYLYKSIFSSLSAFIYTIAPFFIAIFPSPMKINQYLASYISVSLFFASDGRSSSSPNCDAVFSFPIDTMEAIMTTILAVILFPPIVYLFAQVLFPAPMAEVTTTFNPSGDEIAQQKSAYDIYWRMATALASVDWFFMKAVFNLGLDLQQNMHRFITLVGETYGKEDAMKSYESIFQDPSKGAAQPEVAWFHVWDYLESSSTTEYLIEEMKWKSQKQQFPNYYDVVKSIKSEVIKRSEDIDFCSTGPLSLMWRWFFWTIGCWIPPLQIVLSSTAREIWMNVIQNYYLFFCMSAGMWTDDMERKFKLIEQFKAFESTLLTMKEDVQDASDIKTMDNPIFARDIKDSSSIIVDAASRISTIIPDFTHAATYGRKGMFTLFLSATSSCRSVLWQIIPGMTGFAIVAVETSECPILVFSSEVRSNLPPLVKTDAWSDAKERLSAPNVEETEGRNPMSWKVFLLACYIVIKESRLLQFSIAMTVNIVTFYVVFSSSNLDVAAGALLSVVLLNSFVEFGHYLVELYEFFFEEL